MVLEDLPPEITLMIFSHLTQEELYDVSKVSKKLRRLAFDPFLWKKIKLNGDLKTIDEMRKILTRCSRVREVKFSRISDFCWISSLPKCEFVEKIVFKDCTLEDDFATRFVKLYPRVFSLKITECEVDYHIVNRFLQWEFLKSISLIDWKNSCFSNDGEECVVLIADKCKNLEELYMPTLDSDLTDRAIVTLTKFRGPQLKTLSINCCNLTSVSYQSLKCCRRLKNLYLYYIEEMTDADEDVINSLKLANIKLGYNYM